MDSYKTLASLAKGYVNEQRSKFLSFALPVQTPEQAKEVVAGYRKQYYDARHVCWAYVLGAARTQFRVNDDGEPSSTAGKPILGVIHSNGLTDVLILVVRYFGGVKLGPSGLIAAYRAAAQDAVGNAQVVEKTVDEAVTFAFEYPFLDRILKIVKEDGAQVRQQAFGMPCRMTLCIRQSAAERLRNRLQKVESVSML
ncbi:MAG: IMPACT family protein [Dysgonamonadaceae bacterium]|jgi:uncharacterized YigZ family protein|nr:IMPACT family protein [Dysgonamonadaceae bacterium]